MWTGLAFVKRVGRAPTVAALMRRPGSACQIALVTAALTLKAKSVPATKAGSEKTALRGSVTLTAVTMDGKRFNALK